MAKFKVLKPFHGTEEKRDFTPKEDAVEMTVKRAEEIQKNIDKSHPDYGQVLERIDEQKKETAAQEEPKQEAGVESTPAEK